MSEFRRASIAQESGVPCSNPAAKLPCNFGLIYLKFFSQSISKFFF